MISHDHDNRPKAWARCGHGVGRDGGLRKDAGMTGTAVPCASCGSRRRPGSRTGPPSPRMMVCELTVRDHGRAVVQPPYPAVYTRACSPVKRCFTIRRWNSSGATRTPSTSVAVQVAIQERLISSRNGPKRLPMTSTASNSSHTHGHESEPPGTSGSRPPRNTSLSSSRTPISTGTCTA